MSSFIWRITKTLRTFFQNLFMKNAFNSYISSNSNFTSKFFVIQPAYFQHDKGGAILNVSDTKIVPATQFNDR
jgi:hypothetical protein